MRRRGWIIPAAVFCGPLAAAFWLGVAQSFDASAWRRLFADSQFWPALALSLWVAMVSMLIVGTLTIAIVTQLHAGAFARRWPAGIGAMLALPHAAFAIGFALLLMPSGAIMRVVAGFTGWSSPPDIATVQDRAGLALIAALVLKEVPFMVWSVAAQLHRVGQGADIERQVQVAATMGYSRRSAWARIVWPQLLPRLALPLLAVWAYGMTVVDMALVLGPTRPPTLGVLAWQWLQDADEAVNRQGAAAALLLGRCVAAGSIAARLLGAASWPVMMRRWTRGDRPAHVARLAWPWQRTFNAAYLAVLAMLVFISFVGVWTFPSWWPAQSTMQAWQTALASGSALGVTLILGLMSAGTGLVLAVAWMETTPAHWDASAAPALFAPMLIPGVLLVGGLYQLALHTGTDGSIAGLWVAHSLYAAPYVLVALAPAYRAFDARYEHTALALGKGRSVFLAKIKLPMLLAPLAAAFAVGFAVSVAQYLSTQFVGAGRHATVTTEALTLASGGQRSLAAAFALLQALLPAMVFIAARGLGQAQAHRLHQTAVA